jgi:small GTP-binding protein
MIPHHKLVLLGDTSVGKTCIVHRLVRDIFYEVQESTIGSAFTTKIIQTDKSIVKFEIWDTAGQERYRTLAPMYYRGARVAIVVYDITDKQTFENAKKWVNEIQLRGLPDVIIALVGNKTDLESSRQISVTEVVDFINELNILWYETSAKTGIGINTIFEDICNRIPHLETTNEIELKFAVTETSIPKSRCYCV